MSFFDYIYFPRFNKSRCSVGWMKVCDALFCRWTQNFKPGFHSNAIACVAFEWKPETGLYFVGERRTLRRAWTVRCPLSLFVFVPTQHKNRLRTPHAWTSRRVRRNYKCPSTVFIRGTSTTSKWLPSVTQALDRSIPAFSCGCYQMVDAVVDVYVLTRLVMSHDADVARV